MATPIISTLRRNQGYILAVMGVVLIVTWVIGPAAMDFFGGGSRGRQPKALPAMQWNKAGTTQFLSDGDLMHMRQEHMAVLDFTDRVVKRALDDGRTPQAPGLNVKGDPSRYSVGLKMDTSEATVVNIMLLAERGREMGVRIDKEAMISYLQRLSDFSMDQGDFRDLAQQTVKDAVEKGQVVSVDSLFSALRKELVAQETEILLMSSVMNVSTGELWDLHKQLNMRYKIEAYPIDVEKLKASFKAADAKPEELMAIYTKGKNQVPNPDGPEPGFRVPHRIAFGYCTVDFEHFLAQAKKNVTEEKALERYEKGVAQGDYRKPRPLTEKPKEAPGETKPSEEKPGETKPGEEKPGEEKPAGEEKKPAEPEKKEEPKPGEPTPEEKSIEKPSEKETKPAAEKAEDPATEKPSIEKPVAVVCNDELDKAAKSEEGKKAEESKPAAKDEKAEPAKEETEKTKPATKDGEKVDPANSSETAPGEESEAVGEKADDPTKTEKKEEPEEILHKTFPEVRDLIKTELAQPEAVRLRDAALEKAVDELRNYSTKLKRFEESKKEKETGVEDPGPFRPDAFAKKYGFAYGKTNLVDQHQADTTVLGQDAILSGTQGSYRFAEFAFSGNVSLFDPQVASAFGENKYIFWRTDDQPEQDAELEEDGKFSPALKAQVEDAWLKQKAFEAAKKKAEELVAKVKGSSLRDVVGNGEDAKVVQPVPFSMFTTNGVFLGRAMYSQPNGIPLAGREFMEAVFALKPGEAGVAVDQPHNVVYAVHVLADDPSLDVRREMFLESLRRGRFTDLNAFAMVEKQGELESLFSDVGKHFGVKWNRMANMGREEE